MPADIIMEVSSSGCIFDTKCCFSAFRGSPASPLLLLQALFDLQLSSIKHYNIGTFTPDVKVHHIVHRYAQLTASLLSLNADYQVWLNKP